MIEKTLQRENIKPTFSDCSISAPKLTAQVMSIDGTLIVTIDASHAAIDAVIGMNALDVIVRGENAKRPGRETTAKMSRDY